MGLGTGQHRCSREHTRVWYPQLTLGAVPEGANRPNHEFGALAQPQADARGVRREPVFTVSSLDDPIADAADATCACTCSPCASPSRTPSTSTHLRQAHERGPGPITARSRSKTQRPQARRRSGRHQRRALLRRLRRASAAAPAATVNVLSIDQVPTHDRLTWSPPRAHRRRDRVRLGAHLSEGTTVMHAGFVNFTRELWASQWSRPCLARRRRRQRLRHRRRRLHHGHPVRRRQAPQLHRRALPARRQRGIGISLGDNCVVEAGLYVTAGTKITVWDKAKAAAGEPLDVVKGADLSGKDNILFIRNSVNGRIEARYRKTGIELNAKLHKTDCALAERPLRYSSGDAFSAYGSSAPAARRKNLLRAFRPECNAACTTPAKCHNADVVPHNRGKQHTYPLPRVTGIPENAGIPTKRSKASRVSREIVCTTYAFDRNA